MEQNNQGKITDLSIAAFILSILVITSALGVILGIVDVSQKDGRSKGLSVAAITVGVFFMVIIGACALITGMHKEEAIVRPQVKTDYSLPNAPIYEPEETPIPSPTETPEETTL